jgi:hypothetical protein
MRVRLHIFMRDRLSRKFNNWNWGAFLLCPFWCIRYRVWIGTISLFPAIVISLMSLISLCSFYLLAFTFEMKLPSLLSRLISSILFCFIYISGGLFFYLGKTTTTIASILFYMAFSFLIGLEGDKLAIRKMSTDQNIQEFNLAKYRWLCLGLVFFLPLYIVIFYLTEKSVILLIDLVQLPGI